LPPCELPRTPRQHSGGSEQQRRDEQHEVPVGARQSHPEIVDTAPVDLSPWAPSLQELPCAVGREGIDPPTTVPPVRQQAVPPEQIGDDTGCRPGDPGEQEEPRQPTARARPER